MINNRLPMDSQMRTRSRACLFAVSSIVCAILIAAPAIAEHGGRANWRIGVARPSGESASASSQAGIHVTAGTYGGSCGQPEGNVTAHLAGACNGKSLCEYSVDYTVIGDPAPGCKKDYVAKWTCGGGGEHTSRAEAEAGFGSKLLLACRNRAEMTNTVPASPPTTFPTPPPTELATPGSPPPQDFAPTVAFQPVEAMTTVELSCPDGERMVGLLTQYGGPLPNHPSLGVSVGAVLICKAVGPDGRTVGIWHRVEPPGGFPPHVTANDSEVCYGMFDGHGWVAGVNQVVTDYGAVLALPICGSSAGERYDFTWSWYPGRIVPGVADAQFPTYCGENPAVSVFYERGPLDYGGVATRWWLRCKHNPDLTVYHPDHAPCPNIVAEPGVGISPDSGIHRNEDCPPPMNPAATAVAPSTPQPAPTPDPGFCMSNPAACGSTRPVVGTVPQAPPNNPNQSVPPPNPH